MLYKTASSERSGPSRQSAAGDARQVALRAAILAGRGQRSLLPARRELSRHGVSARDGSV